MTYPSIPITISWLQQWHYYYFGLAKHLIWFPRIRYDKPLTIIGIFTNMAVFPTGTTWIQLEPVGTTWIQLESRCKIWRVFPSYLAGTIIRKFHLEPVGHSKDLKQQQV